MSKRITRIGLGAAVAIAATAVAGGAFASAASLPDQPASEAIASTVIQINEDGSGIECTLSGPDAQSLVGDVSLEDGDVVMGVAEVSDAAESPEGAMPDGWIADGEPIPVTELVEGGELPEGTELGVAVSGSTDVDVDGAEGVLPAAIVSFDGSDLRPGTAEECAAIVGDIAAVPGDQAPKD